MRADAAGPAASLSDVHGTGQLDGRLDSRPRVRCLLEPRLVVRAEDPTQRNNAVGAGLDGRDVGRNMEQQRRPTRSSVSSRAVATRPSSGSWKIDSSCAEPTPCVGLWSISTPMRRTPKAFSCAQQGYARASRDALQKLTPRSTRVCISRSRQARYSVPHAMVLAHHPERSIQWRAGRRGCTIIH